MLARLYVHDDAKQDLVSLRRSDPLVAGKIVALLEQLNSDSDLLDRLTQHDYGAYRSAKFHVSKWQAQWQCGENLWRLKLWDLEDAGLQYRVVYGVRYKDVFKCREQHYHILAIIPREFNYDSEHPLSQRIFRAFEEL